MQIEEWLADNYRAVKAERGCTWEELAQSVETGDAALAGWLRAQAAGEQRSAAPAPKGRQAPRKAKA